jgi:hypothetical protein
MAVMWSSQDRMQTTATEARKEFVKIKLHYSVQKETELFK